jgi:hypothetical protein
MIEFNKMHRDSIFVIDRDDDHISSFTLCEIHSFENIQPILLIVALRDDRVIQNQSDKDRQIERIPISLQEEVLDATDVSNK